MLVEIQDRDRLAIHQNVGEVVDALLRGYQPQPEVRQRTAGGAIDILQQANPEAMSLEKVRELRTQPRDDDSTMFGAAGEAVPDDAKPLLIFPYGVSRNKIERAVHNLRVHASIARKWDDADVVLTLKTLETQGVGPAQVDRGRERPDLLDQDEHDDADSERAQGRLQPALARRRRDRDARGRGSRLPSAARQPGGRADAADVVHSPNAAPVRRAVLRAVAQHRTRTESPRPDLQRSRRLAVEGDFPGVVDGEHRVELENFCRRSRAGCGRQADARPSASCRNDMRNSGFSVFASRCEPAGLDEERPPVPGSAAAAAGTRPSPPLRAASSADALFDGSLRFWQKADDGVLAVRRDPGKDGRDHRPFDAVPRDRAEPHHLQPRAPDARAARSATSTPGTDRDSRDAKRSPFR